MKYYIDSIYKNCNQMAHVKDVGGPVGYLLRSSAASIIKQTEEKDFSVLWANDPEPEIVKEQTFQVLETSAVDIPHTCERFESNNPGGCAGCNFKGKVKSPITLGANMHEAPSINITLSSKPTETYTDAEAREFGTNMIVGLIDTLFRRVNDLREHTLVTQGGGTDHKGKPTPMYALVVPEKRCLVRYEQHNDKIYIDVKQVRDVLSDMSIKQLIKVGYLSEPISVNMMEHANMPPVTIECYVLKSTFSK